MDKIFSSSNAKYGISLLKELELDKELEIYNLDEINKKIKQQGTGSVPPPPPPKNPSSIGDDDFNKRPYLDAEEHRRRVNNISRRSKGT